MPWKKNDDDQVIIEDGNPIFIHPDGREEQFNGDSALIRIGELKNESKERRQKYADLKKQVQPILEEEIDDVGAYLVSAKEALDLVKTYKEKGTPGTEEIERMRQSVAESFETRMADKEKLHKKDIEGFKKTIKAKSNSLKKQLVKSAFDASEFIREKTNMIPEFAYDSFGKHFVVEEKDDEPSVHALDANGEKIFSLKGSSYADPQEAIEILIRSHPQKDKLLKSGSGGSGARGGAGSAPFTGKTIDASDHEAASQNIEKIASGEVTVTE